METILTVLSTIGVGALAYAAAGVIRLSRRVDDLEQIRMEIAESESRWGKHLDEFERALLVSDSDIHRRLDEYQREAESNLDKRFDNVWYEIHKINKSSKTKASTVIN